jgi:cytosine/adenosine deaminase-related metal-dependent hydrolase
VDYTISGGTLVTEGKEPLKKSLHVSDKIIKAIDSLAEGAEGGAHINLHGSSFVYPALINTHDHLQGNYRPAVGPKPGAFYLTWQPWDNDLKASNTFRERSNLSREDLYALSGYKCLFSGVATVNDHFPQKFNSLILPTLPIRAFLEYGISHEATSYDLKWGDGVEIEHQRAIDNNWPYITHLSEGFDEEAMNGVETMVKMGILDDHCLFIHCIGFSDDDIQKVAKAGASVAWCGFSNMFMFNVTCKVKKMLEAGVNLTIGTDSSASGSANLLAEMKFDRKLYQKMYGEDLSPRTIFGMVTANAARAFQMQDRTGRLEEGKAADILVLKAKNDDPYENLLSAEMTDIELLTLEGEAIYGETRFLELSGGELPAGYTIVEVGGRKMFVKGDPAGLYTNCRKKIGFKKALDFLPFEPEPGSPAYVHKPEGTAE